MLIVVCVKQVPDTNTIISISSSAPGELDTSEFEWIMNPYDEFALEEALRIKESHKDPAKCQILLVSLGPARVEKTLRQGLAMGADSALLLETDKFFDPKVTSYLLSRVLKDKNPDLILTGAKGIDYNHGTTSAMLAQRLNVLYLPFVIQLTKPDEQNPISQKWSCCLQSDFEEILECTFSLPVLISVEKGINQARYPSLMGIMQAKKKPLSIKPVSQLLSSEQQALENDLLFHSFHYPPSPPKAQFLTGSPEEQAQKLLQLLKDSEGITLYPSKGD